VTRGNRWELGLCLLSVRIVRRENGSCTSIGEYDGHGRNPRRSIRKYKAERTLDEKLANLLEASRLLLNTFMVRRFIREAERVEA